ncbi:unnamed protein product, partial [Notodromas monacha]
TQEWTIFQQQRRGCCAVVVVDVARDEFDWWSRSARKEPEFVDAVFVTVGGDPGAQVRQVPQEVPVLVRQLGDPALKAVEGHKNGRFFNSSAEDVALSSSSTSHATSLIGGLGAPGKSLSSSMLCSSLSAETLEPKSDSTGSFKAKSKQLTRWGGIFGNSKDVDRMEELAEQLNQYGKYGIPPLSSDNSLASEHEDFRLEDDWTSIVADASRFSERKRQQQTAIWELIQTEAAYIVDVEVITKLFLACLMNLRKSRILVDIDVNKLFANMQDILNANVDFWRRTILPMLEIARSSKEPLDPSLMKDGFC